MNSTLDRLESPLNHTAIENVSQSAQDRIQALGDRLNGNDMNKTLGKITLVDYSTGNHPERNNPKRTNGRSESPRSLLQVGNRHTRTNSRGTIEPQSSSEEGNHWYTASHWQIKLSP